LIHLWLDKKSLKIKSKHMKPIRYRRAFAQPMKIRLLNYIPLLRTPGSHFQVNTLFRLVILSMLLFSSAANAQYCMLTGDTPYSTDQPGITNFKLNTINRTSSNVESMSSVVVVTADTTVLLKGHTYTVTLTHSRDSVLFPTVRNNIRVWIDYNNNFSFDDAGETVISADYQTYGIFTATFTVPSTAPTGTVRLRATAKMSSDGGHTAPTSCDVPADPVGYHGEMEDYTMKIMAPTGISETNASSRLPVIFPNPACNQFSVLFDGTGEEPVSIILYDMTGKLVQELLALPVQSSSVYTFDMNNYPLSNGLYLLRVAAGGSVTSQKIIKSN
jgi:hypothetical protein